MLQRIIDLSKEIITDKPFKKAVIFFAICNLIDYISTYLGLKSGEIVEANPIINISINLFGKSCGIIIPKLIFFVIVIFAFKYMLNKKILNSVAGLYVSGIGITIAGSSCILYKFLIYQYHLNPEFRQFSLNLLLFLLNLHS